MMYNMIFLGLLNDCRLQAINNAHPCTGLRRTLAASFTRQHEVSLCLLSE